MCLRISPYKNTSSSFTFQLPVCPQQTSSRPFLSLARAFSYLHVLPVSAISMFYLFQLSPCFTCFSYLPVLPVSAISMVYQLQPSPCCVVSILGFQCFPNKICAFLCQTWTLTEKDFKKLVTTE